MKKRIIALASAGAVIAAGLAIAPHSVTVNGSYEAISLSPLTSKVVVTLPYESVPNATFYSLSYEKEDFELSTFESPDSGVKALKLLLNPPEKVNVIVYDREQKPIGRGNLTSDGGVVVKFDEKEVVR